MLSQIRASFQPILNHLSEQDKLERRSVQLPIPNITEPSLIPDHDNNDPPSEPIHQLSPTSLSQSLSPTSLAHSNLSLTSPGIQSSLSDRPLISPTSSSLQSPVKPTMPAEMFVIVRPPPGKQNHPLNLQIQLILPHQTNLSRQTSFSTPAPTTSSPLQTRQILTGRPISSASDTLDGSGNPLRLSRTHSTPSVHSNRSSRSNRSCSSGGEVRNRRVTPLYNLEWHTVLPTWISDAGTDAKVAKFAKRGIELVDLANIEPSEIRSERYASDLNLLLNGVPISQPAQAPLLLSTPGTPTPSLFKPDRPGAAALFNKVKRLSVFNKKAGSKLESESTFKPVAKKLIGMPNTEQFSYSDLPSTNAGLSTVGPTMEAGGRRAEGYAWIVRKWNKPEIVDWQNSSTKTNQINPVFMEWRKAKRRARGPVIVKNRPGQGSSEFAGPLPPPPPPVQPQSAPALSEEPETIPSLTPPAVAPDSALKPFTIPAATTTEVVNFFGRFSAKAVELTAPEPVHAKQASANKEGPTPKPEPTALVNSEPQPVVGEQTRENSVVQSTVGLAEVDEESEDSDPEDSESPWHCELVIQADDGRQQRFFVASLTPHPHHPRLVAQLAVPWNLEPISLTLTNNDDNDDDDTFVLDVEEIKDLIAVTCMWLVVKERLGGIAKRRKGDRFFRI